MNKLERAVIQWAADRNIFSEGTFNGQLIKLKEEFDELTTAHLENDMNEIADAIGDMQVVLIILAEMYGLSAEGCLAEAYNVISKRKGKMVDGQFVKESE